MNGLSLRRGAVPTLLLLCLIGWPLAAQQESSPEAQTLFNDAANFQNNGAFELAVEEWQKFLKGYPKDPLTTEARHYLGVCHLKLQQYEPAVAALQAVVAADPEWKFKLIQDTYLNLGWSQFVLGQKGNKESFAAAAETLGALAKKYPDGKHADQALYFQGEALYLSGKKKEAAFPYTRLVNDHRDSPLRDEAMYALGVTHEELKRWEHAFKVFQLLLKAYPDHELATEVKMRSAEAQLQLNQLAEAEKTFAEVAATEGFAEADHALLRQAFCTAKQNKSAEAAGLYARLVADYPQSVYVADATMAAGQNYYLANQLDQAATWLAKAAADGGPGAVEAAHWLCRIQLKKGQPAQALKTAGDVLPGAAASPFVVPLKMDQADAMYEIAARRAEAMDLYLKIAADHPQDKLAAQALYNAAFAAQELKKYDQGLQLAGDFLTKHADDPLTPDVKYVAAECQLQLGNHADAEAGFAELVTAHADRGELNRWRVRLALTRFLQNKFDETIAALEPALGELRQPELIAEAQFLLGSSHLNKKQYQPAAAALVASFGAAPKWRQADQTLLNLAQAQRRLNHADKAQKSLQRLLADFPNSGLAGRAHFQLADLSFDAGKFQQAAEQYQQAAAGGDAAIAPHALHGKGWADMRRGDQPAAIEAFTALVDNYPNHELAAKARFARARCHQQAKQFAEAIADVDAFLATNPERAQRSDALYVRGLSQVGSKQFAAAAATLQSILTDHADYAHADAVLYELAWAHKSGKDDEAAVKAFAQLVNAHTDSKHAAEAWYHLGEHRYDQEKFDTAADAYRACLQRDPKGDLSEKAQYKLGWAQYQQDDFEGALALFSEQVDNHPGGSLARDGRFMKAECLFKLEQFEQALPAYAALRGEPLSSDSAAVLVLLHGGQAAGQLKQWEDSLKWLAEIVEKHPESPYAAKARYEQGWAQQNLGDGDLAMKSYQAVVEQSRSETGARAAFMIGELHFGNKDYAAAVRQFQRVMYGYGGEQAPAAIKRWQAKAGLEAGQCAALLASQERDAQRKAKLIDRAKQYFRFVVEKHPNAAEAAAAEKQLTDLGG